MEFIDTSSPEVAKAINLARELVEHCNEHNFDIATEVFGVAINAHWVKEVAYCEGGGISMQQNKIDQERQPTTLTSGVPVQRLVSWVCKISLVESTLATLVALYLMIRYGLDGAEREAQRRHMRNMRDKYRGGS